MSRTCRAWTPATIFKDIKVRSRRRRDDDCGMVVPHNCEPGMKDFGSCSPTVNSVCAHMKDTSAACNVISATVKQSKIQYDAIAVGSNPCHGDAKTTAAGAQQAYKQALNKWSDAINAAGDVCTVGHGLWMYNAEMYNTHYAAMKEITADLSELCESQEEFDVENAIEEAKKTHVPTVRRRHLTWWRKDLCEPTINALESITGTLDIVTPELQCYADTCQKAIAAEATAFAELKSAHGAYKTAIGDYKDRAKTYNTAVTNKMDLKASTLSALEGFKSIKQTEGPIFQRDLTAFNRYDDGSDQGRCGLTSCQLHSVCKHQIKDHFADFVNKDTCKAVPMSADNICQSESCQRIVTVTRTDGDSWGMDLKFKCGDKTLSVGPSDGKTKMIQVDGLVDGSCPSIVNQKNWLGGETHGDTFTVTNGVCIRKAEFADGVYSLKGGREGKFCASEGNKIVCDRGRRRLGNFIFEKHGDWYGIKAYNGKYCADERHAIKCDRGIGGWERFNIGKIGGKFALRPDREHKYCGRPTTSSATAMAPRAEASTSSASRIRRRQPFALPPSPRRAAEPPPPDPNRRLHEKRRQRVDAHHGWGMDLSFNCHGQTIRRRQPPPPERPEDPQHRANFECLPALRRPPQLDGHHGHHWWGGWWEYEPFRSHGLGVLMN